MIVNNMNIDDLTLMLVDLGFTSGSVLLKAGPPSGRTYSEHTPLQLNEPVPQPQQAPVSEELSDEAVSMEVDYDPNLLVSKYPDRAITATRTPSLICITLKY
jgi:hypothetical protein